MTGFFLAADGEHERRVELRNVSTQRDIPLCAATHHELSEIRSHRPAYQGIAFQHVDCPDDVVDARGRIRYLMLDQMHEGAIDVVADLRGELDARHD